jgi:hypothetical protein
MQHTDFLDSLREAAHGTGTKIAGTASDAIAEATAAANKKRLTLIAERAAGLVEPKPGFLGSLGKDIGSTFAKSVASEGGKGLIAKFTRPSLARQVFGRGGMLPKALVFGGAAAGLAAGSEAAERYYDKKRRGPAALEKNINNMYAEFPDMAAENKTDVRRAMRTLQKFSPRSASDPLVARSWAKKYLMYKDEGIQPGDLKTLADTSRSLSASGSSTPMVRAFEDATRFAG